MLSEQMYSEKELHKINFTPLIDEINDIATDRLWAWHVNLRGRGTIACRGCGRGSLKEETGTYPLDVLGSNLIGRKKREVHVNVRRFKKVTSCHLQATPQPRISKLGLRESTILTMFPATADSSAPTSSIAMPTSV